MRIINHNLLWKHSSLLYIIRRSDFQAKILKEIRNNYYGLTEYNKHALSIIETADRNSIEIEKTNFLLLRTIPTNAMVLRSSFFEILRKLQ